MVEKERERSAVYLLLPHNASNVKKNRLTGELLSHNFLVS